MCAIIQASINYCNSLLALCPKYLTDKLQLVLRATTRLILQFLYRSSVTELMHWQLHWLDIQSRVRFKIDLLMYEVPPRVGSPIPLRLVCPGASFIHSLLPAFSPGFGSIFSWSLERERRQLALLAYSLRSSNHRLLLSHLWMLSFCSDSNLFWR